MSDDNRAPLMAAVPGAGLAHPGPAGGASVMRGENSLTPARFQSLDWNNRWNNHLTTPID